MLREKVEAASFVVTISEYNRRFILDHVGDEFADKIAVIHCGIDPSRYARDSHTSDTLEIVCIGTLHEVKGQRFLLEACERLSVRGIPWRCHLIGGGPDLAALEAHAKALGISEQVVFHGHCERQRVRTLLGKMDVCVAPSVPTSDGRREGIPVVLMEAAACALPLVASRLSGIPEFVRDGETGLLAEPGDVAGLESALARLATEPDTRVRLGAAARERLDQSFNLEQNVRTLRERILIGTAQ